jgi:hypothetical protein
VTRGVGPELKKEKSETKGQILCNSTYVRDREEENSQRQKEESLPGGGKLE